MKLIKERAEELYPQNKPTMYTQFVAGLEQLAFKAGVEFAQRWISVEDELPFGYVTLKCRDDFEKIIYISLDFSGVNDVDTEWLIKKYKATHWRPIELK